MTESAYIRDVTTDQFDAEVVQRSLKGPVLVDFWAPWCGPCQQLIPVLEKLAEDYNGAFVLTKVNVDTEQQLAVALQIKSVPTVMLVKDGQLVDGFPGALPESQVREFLAHHGVVPAEAAEVAEEVQLEPEPPADPADEVARLAAAIEAEPDKQELKLDLALALLRIGESDQARTLLDSLSADLAADDRAKRAHAQLDFASALKDAPPAGELERRLQADPDDHAARRLLGIGLIVAGQNEAGLVQLLELLRRDRDWSGGLPRKALLAAFQVIDDPDMVSGARRQMASILF
ncbi:MAG: thioredoxin [Xanthomonadaceae bacterium]|nr:thioredoxin [Xanthomonadaceae bacterium]